MQKINNKVSTHSPIFYYQGQGKPFVFIFFFLFPNIPREPVENHKEHKTAQKFSPRFNDVHRVDVEI